jgi:hypothetical protein
MSPAFLILYGILLILTPVIFLSSDKDLKDLLTAFSPKQLLLMQNMLFGGFLFLFSGILSIFLL